MSEQCIKSPYFAHIYSTYIFHIILTTKDKYFHIKHLPTDLSDGSTLTYRLHNLYNAQGCINVGDQNIFLAAPDICWSLVWTLFLVTKLPPRIFVLHLDYWKNCARLEYILIFVLKGLIADLPMM